MDLILLVSYSVLQSKVLYAVKVSPLIPEGKRGAYVARVSEIQDEVTLNTLLRLFGEGPNRALTAFEQWSDHHEEPFPEYLLTTLEHGATLAQREGKEERSQREDDAQAEALLDQLDSPKNGI